MSGRIAQWNPVQFAVLCSFTAFATFFNPLAGGLSPISALVAMVVLAVPALFIQMKLGGYLEKGIVGIFSTFFPIWKGVGVAVLIDLLLRIAVFAPLVAQLGTYAFLSMSGDRYVWGNCRQLSLTAADELCAEDESSITLYGQREVHRPEELFYKYEFLQLSRGLTHIGGFPQWHFTEVARKAEISLMPVTLALVWLLVFLFVGFGDRVCGWVMFLLGSSAVACILAVLGYGYSNLDPQQALSFLSTQYGLHLTDGVHVIRDCSKGLSLLFFAVPVWTGAAPTFGRLCGRGRRMRNMAFLVLLIVCVVVSVLPPIAMAPYIASLNPAGRPDNDLTHVSGPELVFWLMPAAFTTLKVPPVYACVFYTSAFLFCLMYLCVSCLTIIDNIMVSLSGWIKRKVCSKMAVHLMVTFLVMCVANALGIVHTTKAGLYYSQLFDQSMYRLRFVHILLLTVGLLVVYVKQNFALLERVVMAFWFSVSALVCSAWWLYVTLLDGYDHNPLYQSAGVDHFSDDWSPVRWAIAAVPLVGVPIGALHTCYCAYTSRSNVLGRLCCGKNERVREQDLADIDPVLISQPSAPPYSYMDGSYPLRDTYKMEYDPPEAEPLYPRDCQTSI